MPTKRQPMKVSRNFGNFIFHVATTTPSSILESNFSLLSVIDPVRKFNYHATQENFPDAFWIIAKENFLACSSWTNCNA